MEGVAPTWAYLAVLLLGLVVLTGVGVFTAAVMRRGRRVMIPDAQTAAISQARTRAAELAAEGRVGDGLACLVAGMRQAEGALKQGQPWAEGVLIQWEAALNDYATEHKIGPSPELIPVATPTSRGDEPAPAS